VKGREKKKTGGEGGSGDNFKAYGNQKRGKKPGGFEGGKVYNEE